MLSRIKQFYQGMFTWDEIIYEFRYGQPGNQWTVVQFVNKEIVCVWHEQM